MTPKFKKDDKIISRVDAHDYGTIATVDELSQLYSWIKYDPYTGHMSYQQTTFETMHAYYDFQYKSAYQNISATCTCGGYKTYNSLDPIYHLPAVCDLLKE